MEEVRTFSSGATRDNDINKYDYVMIIRGDDGTIWPKTKIVADNISFIDSKTLIITNVHGDYDPTKISGNFWGLIKIKK